MMSSATSQQKHNAGCCGMWERESGGGERGARIDRCRCSVVLVCDLDIMVEEIQ